MAKGPSMIQQAVAQLVREKQSVTAKERILIDRLNVGLRKIGYEVVSLTRDGAGQQGARARKRRGMSVAARKAVSQRMKAYWAKRRGQKRKRA